VGLGPDPFPDGLGRGDEPDDQRMGLEALHVSGVQHPAAMTRSQRRLRPWTACFSY
jgi:hypothetical protein